ncbi:DUF2950 family protein [Bosea sp. Root381]|uniref:DUF2950 family protein n=1 Tax=Bosea sp. Root381 TaxID=1736524 RepID=UPI0012E3A3A9
MTAGWTRRSGRAATQPNRPNAGANRPSPSRDGAFSTQPGRAANLQSQRGHASMGARPGGGGRAIDYVAGGKMIGGFAILAYPAEYGRSGVKSFMLSHGSHRISACHPIAPLAVR